MGFPPFGQKWRSFVGGGFSSVVEEEDFLVWDRPRARVVAAAVEELANGNVRTSRSVMIDTMTCSSRIDCLIPGEIIGSSGEHCNGPDIRRINSGGDVIISPLASTRTRMHLPDLAPKNLLLPPLTKIPPTNDLHFWPNGGNPINYVIWGGWNSASLLFQVIYRSYLFFPSTYTSELYLVKKKRFKIIQRWEMRSNFIVITFFCTSVLIDKKKNPMSKKSNERCEKMAWEFSDDYWSPLELNLNMMWKIFYIIILLRCRLNGKAEKHRLGLWFRKGKGLNSVSE